jgi:3-dehydrosphinganine reductase
MDAFTGKHALITGGSSGIGLAIARKLSALGANVTILARREEVLETACREIEQSRKRPEQLITALSADVSKFEQVNAVIQSHIEKHGVPDLLINSAGAAMPGMFDEISMDVFSWMMDVNYHGTVNTTRAVLPGMKARRSGHIINICSAAGFLGVYGYTAYCGSKFAVRGFSDALRAEVKPDGIQVTIVYPGDTDTPQLAFDKEHSPEVAKLVNSSGGLLPPEKVADDILKAVQKKKAVVTPGFEASLFYFAINSIGYLTYPIMDFLVSQAIRDVNKRSLKAGQ